MPEDVREIVRQRLEERKRPTLTETRALLALLDHLDDEVTHLREKLAAREDEHGFDVIQESDIPEQWKMLLEQLDASLAADEPDDILGAVYAWCKDWLKVRARLLTLITTERDLIAEIDRLEQEAETVYQRLSQLVEKRRGGTT